MGRNRIAFVIHDLNSWGGQDKATIEIARRLALKMPVELYACTLDGDCEPALFHRVRPTIRRPVLIKSALFHLATLWDLAWRKRRDPHTLIHAAGACSLVSDVIQVHFVHRAWNEQSAARGLYHKVLRQYDLLAERLAFRPHKTYITVSHRVAVELTSHYPALTRVHVVSPGVDLELFKPLDSHSNDVRAEFRSRIGAGPTEVIVLLVGAYERKGLDCAIRAIGRLWNHERLPVRLVAIGSGDRPRFQAYASTLSVADRVHLLEPTHGLAAVYPCADLLLLPTLYDPFGMVVLEAMASGLPCVVSARAGVSELIENGLNGIKIQNPQDDEEVAAHVASLIRDTQLRRCISVEARKTAKNHSWNEVAKRYQSVLNTIEVKNVQ